MWKLLSLLCLFCFVLLCSSAGGNKWMTLDGDKPVVIARYGFSGAFPECSEHAYSLARKRSLPNSLVSCDVHLTKDGIGICFPSINLMNASLACSKYFYPDRSRAYVVNGQSMQGCFPIDFTFDELRKGNVLLKSSNYRRAPFFDGMQPILKVEELLESSKLSGVWLSVPYNAFYEQHHLNMKKFIADVSGHSSVIKYISSPEVAFLRGFASSNETKRVFQFLGRDDVEPTTEKTYGSILEDLPAVKEFAEGILVPKDYIQRVESQYVLDYTSVVKEGHAAGLRVFASGFANDVDNLPFNYSYDPLLEYLSFFDNGEFCVDGVMSDYPLTPSGAIECFAGMGKNEITDRGSKFMVITNEGASGDLPGCTDAAYENAVRDGADVIDCPVQLTRDGVPFCMGPFNISSRILHLNRSTYFASDLTWSQIQALTPAMYSPHEDFKLLRNPRGNGVGKFMKLADFMGYASNQPSLSGVLISIEEAKYRDLGLNLTEVVSTTLSGSGYKKKVMISSSESAVLKYFKSHNNQKSYELVYITYADNKDAHTDPSSIKEFADSVVIPKKFVFRTKNLVIKYDTGNVSSMHNSGLSVYVKTFRNEFASSAWDFFADPTVEINTYVVSQSIAGIISEFPATANRYRRNNRCLAFKNRSVYLTPIVPGDLFQFVNPKYDGGWN